MMQSKRICFVTSHPMTVDAFLMPHIRRLAEDCQLYVVSNYDGVPPEPTGSISYLDVPLVRRVSLAADAKALCKLGWLFWRYGFDVVHSVTPKAGLLAMLAAWLVRVPMRVHWFTGQVWVTRKGFGRQVLKGGDRLIAFLATKPLADSPSQKAFLVKEGICKENAILVLGEGSICGVDAVRFRPDAMARARVRSMHDIPLDAPVILFLGRLNVDKGLREIAEAMNNLDEHFPDLHWLIVGPDEENMEQYIRQKASHLQNRLHFQDYTREPEAFMAAADIFCLPSYREGFGSSVLEAAAVGVPAVASHIYGLTDAVQAGVTGLLVGPADAKALTAALDRLLQNTALRQSMGEAARSRAVNCFSRKRIVDALADFYKNKSAQGVSNE